MKEIKKWLSSFDVCDMCGKPIKGKAPWFVDGKLKGYSAWALMCPECYEKYGTGLGCGLGQKYDGTTAVLLEGGCK